MEKFVIEGGERLGGAVRVSGSKNAVLPVLAATLLREGAYRIDSVPRLRDVDSMVKLLSYIGARCERWGTPAWSSIRRARRTIRPHTRW